MRAMVAMVILMGVLIFAGVGIIGVTILHRAATAGLAADVLLDEPAGTRIAAISPAGNRLAVLLTGGGADRVVLLDGSGHVVGHVGVRR
jgi:hypothetical protein